MQGARHAKLMLPACLACLPADLLNYISLPRRSVYRAAAKRLCVDVSENSAQLVFLRDEEESVSRLYLKWETIGILMDCTGGKAGGVGRGVGGCKSASDAQTHLFSNQDDAFAGD